MWKLPEDARALKSAAKEAFGAFMKAEIEKWSKLAKETGAKAD